MGKKANPKVIGVFVIGAIVLAVAGILVFGGGKFFAKTRTLVMYFETSVKGLNIGSSVLFRGVKIGEVSDIQAEFYREKLDIRIPVFIKMYPDKFKSIGLDKDLTEEQRKFLLGTLIERGLRATLEMESLVTGQKAVSLQFMPESPVRLIGGHKNVIEIPTVETGLDKLTKKLENLPIQDLVKTAISALSGVDEAVADFRKLTREIDAQVEPVTSSVKKAFGEATTTLKGATKLVDNVDKEVEPIASRAKAVLDEAKVAVDGVGKLAGNIDQHVDPVYKKLEAALDSARNALDEAKGTVVAYRDVARPNSPLRFKLESALTDISAATRSVRSLADLLERKPSSLLAGRGSEGRLYVLTSQPKSSGGIRGGSPIRNIPIAVGPIELAYHLDRPQIVTKGDGTEVKVARDDQWAGELKENFTRVLQENLSAILSSDRIYSFPSDSDLKVNYYVRIMVNRFEARPEGKSFLGVNWSILDKDGEKVLLSRESKFEEKSSSSSFGGSVVAMSKNVAKLSRDIANGISSLAQKKR